MHEKKCPVIFQGKNYIKTKGKIKDLHLPVSQSQFGSIGCQIQLGSLWENIYSFAPNGR